MFSDRRYDREIGLDTSEPKASSTGKRGRGRPPKSAGSSTKIVPVSSDTPRRGRGRPAKVVEASTTVEKAVVATETKRAASTNGDTGKKKRGRPAKISTPHGKTNGITKPQVICWMIGFERIILDC